MIQKAQNIRNHIHFKPRYPLIIPPISSFRKRYFLASLVAWIIFCKFPVVREDVIVAVVVESAEIDTVVVVVVVVVLVVVEEVVVDVVVPQF